MKFMNLLTAGATSFAIVAATACAQESVAPIDTHGVIEGFYGRPWSHQDRLDVIEFMGEVGLKAYIYAPKDDPFHLRRWREPYPDSQAIQLRQLAQTARAQNVQFWYAISPGLSMSYSDPGDYEDLLTKIHQVAELGVNHFGLFVDDVPVNLTHAQDRGRYSSLAEAHADLTMRLKANLEPEGYTIAVTPTIYTDAWGDPEYVEQLGKKVDSTVGIFWTGPDVVSATIAPERAAAWGALLGRPPLVWDNYPVNDFAPWRLFLGPVTGRSPELAEVIAGLFSNPMNQAHASLISLATLADYVADPSGYDPDAAHERALTRLYGDDRHLLDPFLEAFGAYAESDVFVQPLYFLEDTIPAGAISAKLDSLYATANQIEAAGEAGNVQLAKLAPELTEILDINRNRLQEVRGFPGYVESDGILIFDKEQDRFTADRFEPSPTVDGSLGDWTNATWLPMFETNGNGQRTNAAFHWGEEFLTVAVRVPQAAGRIRSGEKTGEGNHISLIVDMTPGVETIAREDFFVFLPAPQNGNPGSPFFTAMDFTGFMARWLRDNAALNFSEFHTTTFGRDLAGDAALIAEGMRFSQRLQGNGYVAEIAIPHFGRNELHIYLSRMTTNGMRRIAVLTRRNYPGDTGTYAVVRRPQ